MTEKRNTIIKALQCQYLEVTNQNLPIYEIPEMHLRGFTTTEKDKKRGVDRMPPPQFRQRTCDLIKEEEKTEESTMDTESMAFDEGKKLRDQQFAATKDFEKNAEEEDADEEENEVKASIAGEQPSTLIFKKGKKEDAKLEDFEMIRIVGKGTFGKVFKVKHGKTGKIYAMKCIRKDVVIENE